jgi:UPF0271 protein
MSDYKGPIDLPMRFIDLNADLGEGCPNDRPLLERVSSASICCGAHAGDPDSIRQTLRWAAEFGVVIGAHPGFPDRESFGRRPKVASADEVDGLIREQVAMLDGLARDTCMPIRFLKPHGALYNQAQCEEAVASGVLRAARALRIPLLGQPGTLLEQMAALENVEYIAEGFPDRRYRTSEALVPRTEPGAVLREPMDIERQVHWLIGEGRVRTLCIHGDEPGAVENAKLVRQTLEASGIAIRSFLD